MQGKIELSRVVCPDNPANWKGGTIVANDLTELWLENGYIWVRAQRFGKDWETMCFHPAGCAMWPKDPPSSPRQVMASQPTQKDQRR